MKKILFTLVTTAALFFTSCASELSVQAYKSDGSRISFSTTISEQITSIVRELAGSEDFEIFSEKDASAMMSDLGLKDVSAQKESADRITAAGTIESLKESQLNDTGMIERTENSMTFKIGPEQIKRIYDLMDNDNQGYLDLLMIPAITGETLSVADYRELLSSVYGPSFASDIADNRIKIRLSSPDGKKTSDFYTTTGEILTSTEEKSWSINW